MNNVSMEMWLGVIGVRTNGRTKTAAMRWSNGGSFIAMPERISVLRVVKVSRSGIPAGLVGCEAAPYKRQTGT